MKYRLLLMTLLLLLLTVVGVASAEFPPSDVDIEMQVQSFSL